MVPTAGRARTLSRTHRSCLDFSITAPHATQSSSQPSRQRSIAGIRKRQPDGHNHQPESDEVER